MELLIPVIVVSLISTLRVIYEYQRGVIFLLGKYMHTMGPGLKLVFWPFQTMRKVDVRVKAVDVPDQEAITRDNISARINAVIYYKVKDAAKSFIESLKKG